MALYQQGSSVDVTGLNPVAPKDIQANNEYIWEYWTPAITFSFISPETLNSFISTLLDVKTAIHNLDPTAADPAIKITGVAIDTQTGNIWVRGQVLPQPTTDIAQEGINPLTVLAVIGILFAAIGAAISLRYVYVLTGGTVNKNPALDPCNNPGIGNYIDCLAQESKWFLIGAAFGILALIVFLFIRFGPKEGTA
jgi:hypothetical protein